MTPNNYPEGLDELVEKVSDPFVKDMEQYSYYGSNYGIPQDDVADFARALLDALDERGYVLVDAKKQEPVVKVSDVMMVFRLMQSGKLTPNTEDGWAASMEAFTVPAIPGRVALPDGWNVGLVKEAIATLRSYGDHISLCTDLEKMLSAVPTPTTQPQGDGSLRATDDDLANLVKAAEEFDDCNETSLDDAELLRLVNRGWLECTYFEVTKEGRAAIDAAMEASNGNA